ncbi:sulfotransferase family 2 domain-containing protein [Tropicibacter oceani]|uniref:Sulfotransferase family 2 domain-containing protein n=1 Tax=Tropicibacter oceani TaxID=3058420 RepID=A0ABY8QLJ5_9RHOB|nr:sulfotransferase family 2 domain-containing protein [Tropicibacter oceani]WGW05516.1 sulfotransferase family 2 domain-containing protein [Tropicibacter oceani]
MIISPGRSYIFVHIPKTGGTSMALALEDRAHRDDILIGDTPKAQKRRGRVKKLTARGRLWKHATLADIDGVLTPDQIDAMTCFTLVRNPWDRMVSYYHWLQAQRFDHTAVTLAQTLDFAGFVRHEHTRTTLKAWPYARYMTDANGVEQAAVYLRLEKLDQDLAPLAERLGIPLEIPHANKSNRRAYQSYYTDDLVDVVADTCAQDIARFGYGFEP